MRELTLSKDAHRPTCNLVFSVPLCENPDPHRISRSTLCDFASLLKTLDPFMESDPFMEPDPFTESDTFMEPDPSGRIGSDRGGQK